MSPKQPEPKQPRTETETETTTVERTDTKPAAEPEATDDGAEETDTADETK